MKTTPNQALQPTANKPETTTPNDDKHSFNWGWIAWPLVVLFFYVLSWGPVMLMAHKQIINRHSPIFKIYGPCEWAFIYTPLHKPMALYLHLCVPDTFDKNGNYISSRMNPRPPSDTHHLKTAEVWFEVGR